MRDHTGKDQPLGLLLYQVTTSLRPQVMAELKPLGIGMPEYVCMSQLAGRPAESNAELARRTGVSPQAMNNVVKSLQELGALTRPDSVSTGRSLPVRLTPKGRRLLVRAEAVVRKASEQILTPLSAEERVTLERLLRSLDLNAVDGAP
ncbi:MarR family winged helix-turn-helix transcriptional regulator [Mycobacterium sp. MS1601]|uniref:MarR family winged helix-turn-helix transcriptional regulator n=1 Tax=Mycobacterium sp. MS1601 TaxID=1936029 RepID=UPI003001142A